MRHLRVLNKYFRRYKYHLILGTLFVTISNIFGVLPAAVIRHALDLVADHIGFYRSLDGFDLQNKVYGLMQLSLLLFAGAVLGLALMKGLFMFFMPILLAWLNPYLAHIFPDLASQSVWPFVLTDLVFASSFIVLGAGFWEKIRCLFVYGEGRSASQAESSTND